MSKYITSVTKGAAVNATEDEANISTSAGINQAIAGATHTVDITDQSETLEFTNGGAVAVTLDSIATIFTAAHTSDFTITLIASGSGTVVTITPNVLNTINTGVSTIVLRDGDYVTLQTDSTGLIWNVINRAERLVLLETKTASASATIDFTGLNTDYERYFVEIEKVFPVTSADALWMHVYESGAWLGGSSYATDGGADSKFPIVSGMVNNAHPIGYRGGYGSIYINQRDSAIPSHFSADSKMNFVSSGTLVPVTENHALGIIVNTDVTRIRFLMSTGNIDTGVFKLYGIRW